MTEPLRPLTLGEILDRTAQLYRSRFLLFLGISVVPIGAVLALAGVLLLVVAWWRAAGAGSVSATAGYVLIAVFAIAVTLVVLPIFLAVTALTMAAINHAVSRVYLGGTTTIRDAYKSIWPRRRQYTKLYLLQALLVGVAPAVAGIILVFLIAAGAVLGHKLGIGAAGRALFGVAAALVFAGLLGYSLWMLLRISLAFPACVVEQISPRLAIKRSFALSQGSKGRIFVLYLLGGALSYLLTMAITLPMTMLMVLLPGMSNAQHAQALGVVMMVVMYAAGFAVQALVKPVYGIALVLFYYDQRIRREGYDIERMMQKAGMAADASPAPEA